MKPPARVLVCSTFPDRHNSNPDIRRSLAQGFSELLGAEAVGESNFHDVLDAMERHAPNLVVGPGSCLLPESAYLDWRRYCDRHGCQLAFWLTDDPYELDLDWKAFQIADQVFSNDANTVLHLDRPNLTHLPLAASRERHGREVRTKLDCDLFFCGVAFENRKRLLRAAAPALTPYRVDVYGDWWPKDLAFARNTRLSTAAICDRYNAALLTLNMGRSLDIANHRLALAASTPGPRTFEAAMAGAVQAYHVDGLEIVEYLEPGKEVLLFDTPTELARLIEEMHADPARRQAIARAAQQRCLAEHTYARRAQRILEVCGFY
ncbi:MAG: glycosyltransferase [Betaproteobacteria bacterium]|nr:glycosyltransferase [Betaproteobacteria bacterium]